MVATKNIDQREINKFSSSEWWNIHGDFQPLHAINPLRLAFLQQQIDLKNKKIIDVGCGGGILAESLAHQGANVLGIDMNEIALSEARNHAKKTDTIISYELSTVETIAEKYPAHFDAVTCMEMLEHVPDPVSVVQACAKLVKPSGHVFFSTLNRNLKAYLLAIIGAEYLLNLLPKGTHNYEKFIRPSELAAWARASNLQCEKMIGITYNPLTQEYKLTQNTDVNYLIDCKKC